MVERLNTLDYPFERIATINHCGDGGKLVVFDKYA
jgi:hypothetical protein